MINIQNVFENKKFLLHISSNYRKFSFTVVLYKVMKLMRYEAFKYPYIYSYFLINGRDYYVDDDEDGGDDDDQFFLNK
jgi:hypothetical protein